MNKKLLISAGAIASITLPIATVISCDDKDIHDTSSLGYLKQEAIKALIAAEKEKPSNYDTAHDAASYASISKALEIAKENVFNAQDKKNVEAEKQAGVLNIKNHIAVYLKTLPSNTSKPIEDKLKNISAIDVVGNAFELTSDKFFDEITKKLKEKISKEITGDTVVPKIEKFSTIVNASGELIVTYHTDKTVQYTNTIKVNGFGVKRDEIIPFKTLVRIFANDIAYTAISTVNENSIYKLSWGSHSITIDHESTGWFKNDATGKNPIALGTKSIWTYIQTVMLKEVDSFNLILEMSVAGLGSTIINVKRLRK